MDDVETINEPFLITRLLEQDTGDTIETRLTDQIHRRFQEEILGSGDVRNWPVQAMRVFEESRDDVVGSMEHAAEYGPSGAAVKANRQRLVRFLRSDDENGGARAAVPLPGQPRRGAGWTTRSAWWRRPSCGWMRRPRRIAATQARYDSRAEKVRERFNRSYENLKEAGRNRLLLGPDRKAAEKFLEHLREETAYYVKLRLRAVACAEAVEFLADVSRDLGTRRGLDADGRDLWDGAIAELVQGAARSSM